MYLNKATIVGNLVRDPELKALPSGTPVCNMTVATNIRYSKKGGEKKEKTEFHSVIVFGSSAENCARFLKKGQQVLVEGSMTTRSWEKPDGGKGYKTEIIASNVQFGASHSPKIDDTEKKNPDSTSGTDKPKDTKYHMTPDIEYPTEEINPDDIPF